MDTATGVITCPTNYFCADELPPCSLTGSICAEAELPLPVNPNSTCISYGSTGRISHPTDTTKYINCIVRNSILIGKVYDCIPSGLTFNNITRWCQASTVAK